MRLLAAIGVAGLAIASSTTRTSTSIVARTAPSAVVDPRDGSTITSRDYVGPARCGECHVDEHARWSQSLHRVMNARVDEPATGFGPGADLRGESGGPVIGDFANQTIEYAGGTARFSRDGRAYVMTVAKAGREVRYRVTRTIGRRGLQEYVGVELGGPVVAGGSVAGGSVAGGSVAGTGVEVRLPFGWWPRYGGWAAQPAFDPWLDAAFDPYTPVREPWAERCPWCHSTYPFEQRIARASGPHRTGHGLEQFFIAAPVGLDTAAATDNRLDVATQVTTGISCESCHLGGREHAAGAPSHLVPRGAQARPGAPVPGRFADERRDPTIVNGTCAQCHSGPSPRLADGTSLRNSSESLDLGRAPCNGITCIDCHDPHRGEWNHRDGSRPTSATSLPATTDIEARAVAACVRCHDRFREPEAARLHAGHESHESHDGRDGHDNHDDHTGHDAVGCLDCHMPRIVMGIDHHVRTHRISSPQSTPEVNACNLCHLDRSLGWTRDALAARFGVPAKLAGDALAGPSWLASKRPAIRLIAAAAYARSPLGPEARDRIAAGLTDPLPYMRAWTKLILDQIPASR